ncbi:MAG: glycosyltransferase [Candidatus Promineifilaceae bacterium]|nr:glycosyltransferase [Candidatus Promineifilaceae bacterium]
MMRMLYITPAFQHPKVRGPNRHYHFIRELSERHEITLLTVARSEIPAHAMEEMRTYTKEMYLFDASASAETSTNRMVSSVPAVGRQISQDLLLRRTVADMRETFERLRQEESFDVVVFHGKSVFPAIEMPYDLPTVTDFCDATSMRIKSKIDFAPLVKRPLLALRFQQVKNREKNIIEKTPYQAFISSRDREAILGPESKAQVIPNGLDLQYWKRRSYNHERNSLIFTGVMDYAPNHDAAVYLIDEILPLLKPEIPDVKIYIAGRSPKPTLQEKAKPNPEVIITGFVDDMRDYLEKAAIFVSPLRYASGMQNKLQEALAMELPTITTSVAAAGLRIEGQDAPLVVADDAQQFAQRTLELLQNPDEQKRLAAESRQFAEQYFDWAHSARQLEQMCIDAVAQHQAAVALPA